MCVVSMVHDYYKPRFDPWITDPFYNPPFCPKKHVPPSVDLEEQKKLAKLIEDFYEAKKGAETVDKLTSQPDCVDPEKAKLEERVRMLERRLAELERKGA